MRIILLSTSVGALGSGAGGGVELTVQTLANGLASRGHSVTIVAPRGSFVAGHLIIGVDGTTHTPSQTVDRAEALVVPNDSVLVNMWQRVLQLAGSGDHDIVLNFSYDALPFTAAGECPIAVAHLVSMGSLHNEMDAAVRSAAASSPHCIAMHSAAQAATFGAEIARHTTVVGGGIDVDAYRFVEVAGDDLAFIGRISAEKGIADVFAVAARSGRRVLAFGVMQDRAVWQQAQGQYPTARVEHVDFLATDELQQRLGGCAALIMVHRWVEAFGIVAIEALACGVPVITYDRGGPVEIVRDGLTGFIVPADDVDAVVAAVHRLGTISRGECRKDATQRFSAQAFTGRVEAWLESVVRP